MKVKLYGYQELKLPPLKTFNERVQYINDKILISNEDINDEKEQINAIKYKKYYNICAIDLSPEEIKEIEKRWLGVKKVNNPLPIENVKMTLDYLTGYIVGAKDFSAKSFSNRYLELKKGYKKKTLKPKEKQEFYNLKNKILYECHDFIFFDNPEMEAQLEKMINILKNIPYKNYTDNFMINDIKSRLGKCKNIKDKVKQIKGKIVDLSVNRLKVKNLIQKEIENEDLFYILQLAEDIKMINQEIKHYKAKIEEEYHNYLLCTEFYYKTK